MGQHDRAKTLKPHWVEYAKENATDIEAAYLLFQERGSTAAIHNTTIAGKALTISFAKMNQTNDATGWRRQIHRAGHIIIDDADDDEGRESSPKKMKTAPAAAAAGKAAAPAPKPADSPQANGSKARGPANGGKETGPATLLRRNSSGSMGSANTAIAAAGGKGHAQDETIQGMIALAKNWEHGNKKHDPKGMIMSNGVRCFWNGKAFYTRNGHLIPAPAAFVDGLPADMMLDGELFIDRGKFQEVSGLARTLLSEPRSWKPVRYVIFDAPRVKGGLMTRLQAAKDKIDGNCKYARVHEHEVCKGHEHVAEELKRVEALGGEGLMLRHPTAEHCGGRSADLLKVKTQHDAERLTIPPPAIGSVITFGYFEITKDGIPRFPSYKRPSPDVKAW